MTSVRALFLLVDIVPHQLLGRQARVLVDLLLRLKRGLARILTLLGFLHALLLLLHDFVPQVIVHLVTIAAVQTVVRGRGVQGY